MTQQQQPAASDRLAGDPIAVVEAPPAPGLDPSLSAGPSAVVHQPAVAMAAQAAPLITFDDKRIKLLADTIMSGADASELDFFMLVCKRTGLDPFAKQIHAMKRRAKVKEGNKEVWKDRWSFQVAIDGFRLIAERTGKYRGQTVPLFCGEDGVWKEVWISRVPPLAAKVGVLRVDFDQPLYAIALWTEYVQTREEYANNTATGSFVPVAMWAKMPSVMLAKVAEALALRKAFPQEMSGLYTEDEMAQADNPGRAEARSAAQTRDGEQSKGGGLPKGHTSGPNWTGDGLVFPYGEFRKHSVPMNAKYNEGATRVIKAKKATKEGEEDRPEQTVECGGQYVISDKRLIEARDWLNKKIAAHSEADQIEAEERTEEQRKAWLPTEDFERLMLMADDVNQELERRLEEQTAPSPTAEAIAQGEAGVNAAAKPAAAPTPSKE